MTEIDKQSSREHRVTGTETLFVLASIPSLCTCLR